MVEGGIGGTVDLRTRMPFDAEGQVVSGSVSLNYGDFIEETDPSASILYSNRWDTNAGEFGLLLNYAYSEISTRTEDRKSIRLNSSHVAISYAVFCLKKKTHTDQDR